MTTSDGATELGPDRQTLGRRRRSRIDPIADDDAFRDASPRP